MGWNIQFQHDIIVVDLFISQAHELKKFYYYRMKHAKGKKVIIIAHDLCASHKQAIYSWSTYTEYFENIHPLCIDLNLLMRKQLNPIVII